MKTPVNRGFNKTQRTILNVYLLVCLIIVIISVISCNKKQIKPCFKADFEILTKDITTQDTVYFKNTSNFGTSFIWDIGNQHSWNEKDLKYLYEEQGYYKVSLFVSDGFNNDTTFKIIYVEN